jgi:subtilisin family serine protease
MVTQPLSLSNYVIAQEFGTDETDNGAGSNTIQNDEENGQQTPTFGIDEINGDNDGVDNGFSVQDCTDSDYAAAFPEQCGPGDVTQFPQDCSNPDYAAAFPEQCGPQDCRNPDYAAAHPEQCGPIPDCFNPDYAASFPEECQRLDCTNPDHAAAHLEECGPQDCTNPDHAAAHLEECGPQDCTNPDHAAAHLEECGPQDCSNPNYAAAHLEECGPQDCSNPNYAAAHLEECGPQDCSNLDYAAAHPEQCNNMVTTSPPKHENTDVVSKNGTLTIRKLSSTSKELIPGPLYLITPNPYATSGSLFVVDNDKNDLNTSKGVVILKNIRFSSYIIQEIDKTYRSQSHILHDISISVNEDLPDPVINIVDNYDLGKPLPYEQIPFQYIIELRDNVSGEPESVADKYESKGVEVVHIYSHAFKGLTLRNMNHELLRELANDPNVLYVERDQEGHIASTTSRISFDQNHRQTIPTGLGRVDELVGYGYQSNVELVDNKSLMASNNTVNADIAIIDTGISNSHPDLNVYKSKTFVENTTSADDDNGHGSHIAGTAAATDNSFGVIGIAPGARLWALKVCDDKGSCPVSNQIKALDYVVEHSSEIDVVNLSIENHKSTLLDKAIERAVNKGVIVVAAAGNSAIDAKSTSPAGNPAAIAVSAIADSDGRCGGLGRVTIGGHDDTFANFSNFGSSVDVSAPGTDIFSTFIKDEYGLESGTSMAAPHVTGYAALYKSEYPFATPLEFRTSLINAATLPSTPCDGKSRGYFSNDNDGFKEPLLYVNIK